MTSGSGVGWQDCKRCGSKRSRRYYIFQTRQFYNSYLITVSKAVCSGLRQPREKKAESRTWRSVSEQVIVSFVVYLLFVEWLVALFSYRSRRTHYLSQRVGNFVVGLFRHLQEILISLRNLLAMKKVTRKTSFQKMTCDVIKCRSWEKMIETNIKMSHVLENWCFVWFDGGKVGEEW